MHVPRTGGNSIQSTLLEYADDTLVRKDDGLQQFELRHEQYGLNKHSKLDDYYRTLGERIHNDFFKFTVVRNPWDRIMSRWFLFKYGPANRPKTKGRSVFRRNIEPRWDKEKFTQFINWHLENTGPDAWSIMRWITINGKVCLDDYIDYDSMQDGYDRICQKLNLPQQMLPRLNQSRRPDSYRSYYDDATRDLVAAVCSDEIEYFGFRFDE